MSTNHPLGTDGSWVELRDPKELRAGDKKTVLKSVTKTDHAMSAGLEITDALIKLLVTNWQVSGNHPIPAQNPRVLDLITIAEYDELTKLVEPAQKLLFPASVEPKDAAELKEAEADPASPTPLTVG